MVSPEFSPLQQKKVEHLFALRPLEGLAFHATTTSRVPGILEYGLDSKRGPYPRDRKRNHAFALHPSSKFNGDNSVRSVRIVIFEAAGIAGNLSTNENYSAHKEISTPALILFVPDLTRSTFHGYRMESSDQEEIRKGELIWIKSLPIQKERIIGSTPLPWPLEGLHSQKVDEVLDKIVAILETNTPETS